MNDIIRELSKIEYDLFVVNSYAVAVQADNGTYYKKNIPLTPFILEKMIENKGSMGCYQQSYRTDRLKWVCFDFDCKDKQNPNVDGLYRECIQPLTDTLDSAGISYLTEFSGRRGIHVWIVFQRTTSKSEAYRMMSSVLDRTSALKGIEESEKWSLDRFPKTNSSKGNVVGSQVKFPLSVHRDGGRSYFFKGWFLKKNDVESDAFYLEQLDIISSYKMQDVKGIYENFPLIR